MARPASGLPCTCTGPPQITKQGSRPRLLSWSQTLSPEPAPPPTCSQHQVVCNSGKPMEATETERARTLPTQQGRPGARKSSNDGGTRWGGAGPEDREAHCVWREGGPRALSCDNDCAQPWDAGERHSPPQDSRDPDGQGLTTHNTQEHQKRKAVQFLWHSGLGYGGAAAEERWGRWQRQGPPHARATS